MTSINVSVISKKAPACKIRNSPFGPSKGSAKPRIAFVGFEDLRHWVVAETTKPFFDSRYIEIKDQTGQEFWILKASLLPRFSSNAEEVAFLLRLDSSLRPVLIKKCAHLLPIPRPTFGNLGELPASPSIQDLPLGPHPQLAPPRVVAPIVSKNRLKQLIKECAPKDAPRLDSRFTDDELEKLLETAQEIDLVNPAANHYFRGKACNLARSLLVGQDANQKPTVYLLLTHVKNGNDRCLGAGGSAEVKYMIDLINEKIIAVKISKKKGKTQQEWLIEKVIIRNEIEMMNRFRDQKEIVQIYFDFDAGDKWYIGMENCNEGDLYYQLIEKNGSQQILTEDVLLKWAIDIAKGLQAIHRQGLAHRDLKLENILLRDGHAKIGDLERVSNAMEIASSIGTPSYWSKEKCTALIENDRQPIDYQKDDLWAFGCILYMLFHKDHLLRQYLYPIQPDEDLNKYLIRLNEFTKLVAIAPDEHLFPGISNGVVLSILDAIFTKDSRDNLTIDSILEGLNRA